MTTRRGLRGAPRRARRRSRRSAAAVTAASLLMAAASALPPAPAAAETAPCHAALVLAMDVSSSVDLAEQTLQAEGLAAALLDPAVLSALLPPGGARVAATAFVWSDLYHQETIAPWTLLSDRAAVERFAQSVAAHPRSYEMRPTALGMASWYAARRHAENPFACARKIVDISGDGATNHGVTPAYHRENGALDGLEINGLVIRGADPDPLPHYLDVVIQGPAAFALHIERYGDYADAIRRKLLRELEPPFASIAPSSPSGG